MRKPYGKWGDIRGKHFHHLVPIELGEKKKTNHIMWKCRCSCGNTTVQRATDVVLGKVKSCGCLKYKGGK